MNSGMVMLQDGTPCIVYDDNLPHIQYIELAQDSHLVTLVWFDGDKKETRLKLEYPLDKRFVALLEKTHVVAVCQIVDKKDMKDLHVVPVKFTGDSANRSKFSG